MSEEKTETPPMRAQEVKPRRRKPSASRIAAIALGAIGLVLLGLILFVPAPDGGILPDEAESGGSSGDSLLQAPGPTLTGQMPESAEYRRSPALEALIGSLRRREEFRVVSPAERVEKGTLIVFRWETEWEGPWKVTILDNRGITLKEDEVADPDYTLSSPKPALYYWTVAKEDTLLHVGRLAVQ